MNTVKGLYLFAYDMLACDESLDYLGAFDPKTPVEEAIDKLPYANRAWIAWIIDRSLRAYRHEESVKMREPLMAVLNVIFQYQTEDDALYERIKAPFKARLEALSHSDDLEGFWRVYDHEFRPVYEAQAQQKWLAECVAIIRPTLVEWLHAIEVLE